MNKNFATLLAGFAGALVQTVSQAAPAPLPEGFGVVAHHATVPAVWSTTSGESPGTVDRPVIERTCATKRALGVTTRLPIFEAGSDRPNSVTIVQIVSPGAWASYETIRGNVCDPSSMDAAHDLCSCTFREMTSRFVHIRKDAGDATTVIDIDLNKASATQSQRKSMPLRKPGNLDASQFGPVVAHEVVAGMPCSVHRQDLGTGRTERCLADAVDSVPVELQLQELSKAMYLLQGTEAVRRDWRRTDRIDAAAEVDLGVFDVPAGIEVRNFGPGAARP